MSVSIMQQDVFDYNKGIIKIDDLLCKYKPYIYSVVGEFKGIYADENDEMITTAMLAFEEAAKGFNPEKGKFYSYAKMVIKSRLTDSRRKEYRYTNHFAPVLDTGDEDEKDLYNHIENSEALKQHSIRVENEMRKLEIDEFVSELNIFGITLSQLEKISPKKNDLRKKYIEAAKYIIKNKIRRQHFFTTGRLPVTDIAGNVNITKKQIDRGRIYIIAVIIIKSGDYDFLPGYLDTGERNEN